MTIPNEALVEKAITAADALATAGKLNPAQADKFIDYVVDESVLKGNAREIRFRNESLEIDKIGIGKRAAVPKAEAKDPGLRRRISTSKVTLTPKEIMVPVEIGDIFKEVNIEGDSVEEHIIKMFARQLANDLEELHINGRTLGHAKLEGDLKDGGSTTLYIKDVYLALFDGWLHQAESGHIVDAAGANIGLSIFGRMVRAMPTKFRRNKKDLRFFMSPDLHSLYLEKLAGRATPLGDQTAAGGDHAPFGVPIVPVPLLDLNPPKVVHLVLPGTTAVSLGHAPVTGVVATVSTLGATPTAKLVLDTDYTLDATAGTIARKAGGAIGDGDTVKVTFDAPPQIILTHKSNFIVGIGRDVRIEKDRDIYAGVNQYAITVKVDGKYEESDALVLSKNIGTSV